MLDAKMAAQIAKEKALEMLGQGSTNLEEVERESYKDADVWSITLSFPRNPKQLSGMASLTADPLQYKRFLINAQTGELVAMKIRESALR
jgi:hypothetical protein